MAHVHLTRCISEWHNKGCEGCNLLSGALIQTIYSVHIIAKSVIRYKNAIMGITFTNWYL